LYPDTLNVVIWSENGFFFFSTAGRASLLAESLGFRFRFRVAGTAWVDASMLRMLIGVKVIRVSLEPRGVALYGAQFPLGRALGGLFSFMRLLRNQDDEGRLWQAGKNAVTSQRASPKGAKTSRNGNACGFDGSWQKLSGHLDQCLSDSVQSCY
jgi:hypothetical protein